MHPSAKWAATIANGFSQTAQHPFERRTRYGRAIVDAEESQISRRTFCSEGGGRGEERGLRFHAASDETAASAQTVMFFRLLSRRFFVGAYKIVGVNHPLLPPQLHPALLPAQQWA